jgi:energy-coupling factor transporter ATP-binding protein EcfA2
MKTIPLSGFISVVKPEYIYLKLTPNNSVRNNNTHKVAKTINSLYKNIAHNLKREQVKLIKFFGKEFLFGTKYSLTINPKVSYYIYLEKRKIEFYFIVPKQYLSVIKEKLNDVWQGVTIKETDELPAFSDNATKYQLIYTKEAGLSLSVDKRNNDLLESNLNIIDVLEDGDKAGIFYNFIPTSQHGWSAQYKSTIEATSRGLPVERNKFGPVYAIKVILSFIQSIFSDLSDVINSPGSKPVISNNNLLLETLKRFNNHRKISDATIKKGTDTVLNTQFVLLSESKEPIRQRNNAKSLAQSFDAIAGDNSLTPKRFNKRLNMLNHNIGCETNKISADECSNFIALPGRELLEKHDFIEKVQTQETAVPEELQTGIMCLGTNTYRGYQQPAYLSVDFDYRMLSLVLIGPNRSGKSKFLANIAKNAIDAGECVIIPDYIGSCQLSEEIASVIPPEKVLEIKCDDHSRLQGLGYNEVPQSKDPFVQYKNAKEQTALLMTLVDSINADDANFTARMGRYFEAASLAVFLQNGSIKDVFAVLMNHKTRRKFIETIPESQQDRMEEYIDYLYELDNVEKGKVVGTRTHLITGAVDRLQKLKINAYIEAMLKHGTENNIDLVKEIQKNQLIVIKMPQRMFLTDNEKDVYTTYWLTKIWLALQIREEKIGDRDKMTKLNLVIDELYQVNNAEKFLTKKLSQLPKFNIKPIISCHYLNQIRFIREELRSANASYMLVSGCDKKNYDELKSELYPYTEEDLLSLPRYHSLNLVKCNNGYAKFITHLPSPISK